MSASSSTSEKRVFKFKDRVCTDCREEFIPNSSTQLRCKQCGIQLHRQRVSAYGRKRWATDHDYRKRKKLKKRKGHTPKLCADCPEIFTPTGCCQKRCDACRRKYQSKKRRLSYEYEKSRMASDNEYRDKRLKQRREARRFRARFLYKTDPSFREKSIRATVAWSKKKRLEDPEYLKRARQNAARSRFRKKALTFIQTINEVSADMSNIQQPPIDDISPELRPRWEEICVMDEDKLFTLFMALMGEINEKLVDACLVLKRLEQFESPSAKAKLELIRRRVGGTYYDFYSKIGSGQIAVGLLRFADRRLVDRLSRMRMVDQKKIAEGELPFILVSDGKGGWTEIRMTERLMRDQAAVNQVFAPDGHIRTIAEQRSWLEVQRVQHEIAETERISPDATVDGEVVAVERRTILTEQHLNKALRAIRKFRNSKNESA